MKQFKEWLLFKVVPLIAYLYISFVYYTSKKIYKYPQELPAEPFVVAIWHRELLLTQYLYKKLRSNHKVVTMVSEHKDGELISKTMRFFGIDAIRGSSSKGSARVLLQAIKKLKDGYDVGITPDGPRGPIYSIADGVIVLAQKHKCKIIQMRYSTTRFIEARSWDRFIIPLPFSTITFVANEPFSIDGLDFVEARKMIAEKMKKDVE